MKSLFALALFTAVGCGKAKDHIINHVGPKVKDPRSFTGVDPKLLPYYERFESDFNLIIDDVPARIVDLEGNRAGVCWTWCYMDGTSFNAIEIDREYLDKISDNDSKVEQLMYHELGHCVFNSPHRDGYVDGTHMPLSIMKPTAFGDYYIYKYYEPEHEYYLDELSDHRYNACSK